MKKRIVSFIFIIISLVLISSCTVTTPDKGGDDTNDPSYSITITEHDNVISWELIEGISTYYVYVDDLLEKTLYNEHTYDLNNLPSGNHDVYVKAFSTTEDVYEIKSNVIQIKIESLNENSNQVNIFMINDTHGAFNTGDFAGLEKVATAINSLEKQNGEYIKILNGDGLQGSYVSSILFGRPIIDALNVMEFDAFVIGNHEFDWGFDKVAQYKDGDASNGEANFPFLGANIIDKSTGKRVSWLDPYTIVENNGVKVGIIGIIGHTQESSILSENVANYEFVYPLELVQTLSKELREEKGCDSVIVSLHDFDEDLNYSMANLPLESRVDAILCGHMHRNEYETYERLDGVMIPAIENRDKNQTAASLILQLDDNPETPYATFTRVYPSSYSANQDVLDVVAKYQDVIDESKRSVGYTPYEISRYTVASYATNAMVEEFDADASIINSGGVRAEISSGDITISDIFEVLPFNNKVYLVELPGSVLINFTNKSGFIYNDDFNPYSLSSSKTYKVAIIDYVFTHPNNSELRNYPYTDTGVLIRDLTIDYMDLIY